MSQDSSSCPMSLLACPMTAPLEHPPQSCIVGKVAQPHPSSSIDKPLKVFSKVVHPWFSWIDARDAFNAVVEAEKVWEMREKRKASLGQEGALGIDFFLHAHEKARLARNDWLSQRATRPRAAFHTANVHIGSSSAISVHHGKTAMRPDLIYTDVPVPHAVTIPPTLPHEAPCPWDLQKDMFLLPAKWSWQQAIHEACCTDNPVVSVTAACRVASSCKWFDKTLKELIGMLIEKILVLGSQSEMLNLAKFAGALHTALENRNHPGALDAIEFTRWFEAAFQHQFCLWWDLVQSNRIREGTAATASPAQPMVSLLLFEFMGALYREGVITRGCMWGTIEKLLCNTNTVEHLHGLRSMLKHSIRQLRVGARGRADMRFFVNILRVIPATVAKNTNILHEALQIPLLIDEIQTLIYSRPPERLSPWSYKLFLASEIESRAQVSASAALSN